MGEHDISALIAWCGTFAENNSHISKTILCHSVVFVNARSCFNSCSAASLAGTRNISHCATQRCNTLEYMDPAAHGALLAHCKPLAATAPPIAVSPTQPSVSASKPDSSSEGLSGSGGALLCLQLESSRNDGIGNQLCCNKQTA